MKMSKNVLAVVFAAVLGLSGAAHAGTGFLDGSILAGNDGSVGNAYQIGAISTVPKTLFVTLGGSPGSTFEEFANFSSGPGGAAAVAATYVLTIMGTNVNQILGLAVEVWNDTHPNGSTLIASFGGNNVTTSFALTAGGQYHFDISGQLGPSASGGQYSVSIAAMPVPEPEVYAMMIAGLGLMGFVARRRKQQSAAA